MSAEQLERIAEALWRFELSDGLADVLWDEECLEDRNYYRLMAAVALNAARAAA